MKNECPMWKKDNKKKAFKATWDDSSDSEESSNEKQKMASLCSMGNSDSSTDEEVMNSNSFDDDIDMSYDDMCDMFNALDASIRQLIKRKRNLKRRILF